MSQLPVAGPPTMVNRTPVLLESVMAVKLKLSPTPMMFSSEYAKRTDSAAVTVTVQVAVAPAPSVKVRVAVPGLAP